MHPAHDFTPEYITDSIGKKKAVILSIEQYEELMEDLEDLAVMAERREEPTVSHKDVVAELKQNGYLSN